MQKRDEAAESCTIDGESPVVKIIMRPADREMSDPE